MKKSIGWLAPTQLLKEYMLTLNDRSVSQMQKFK